MGAKPVVVTIDVATKDTMTIVIQLSKREKDKISVWLNDYRFGDVNLEVVKILGKRLWEH